MAILRNLIVGQPQQQQLIYYQPQPQPQGVLVVSEGGGRRHDRQRGGIISGLISNAIQNYQQGNQQSSYPAYYPPPPQGPPPQSYGRPSSGYNNVGFNGREEGYVGQQSGYAPPMPQQQQRYRGGERDEYFGGGGGQYPVQGQRSVDGEPRQPQSRSVTDRDVDSAPQTPPAYTRREDAKFGGKDPSGLYAEAEEEKGGRR